MSKPNPQQPTLLDQFSLSEIKDWAGRKELLSDFHWDQYTYYANERSKLADKIRIALVEGAKEYTFNDWFRIVTQKYNNRPLSAAGSRMHPNGGRFNFGQIDKTRFSPFSCLYIASDEETAKGEKYQLLNKEKDGIKREDLPGTLASYSAVRLRTVGVGS